MTSIGWVHISQGNEILPLPSEPGDPVALPVEDPRGCVVRSGS